MQPILQVGLAPFNIELLVLKEADLKGIAPVKVLDIFVSSSVRSFHPDGLFSTEIFGKFGEARRNRLFSYIDLNVGIFHPVVYKALIDLKGLYDEIMAGRAYAVFNEETKDFEESDLIEGETGFNFFMKHYHRIEFKRNDSTKRTFNIELIEKYKNTLTMDKLVVLPAGLRDYTIDENGKPSEDEINGLYRRVLSLAGLIDNVDLKINLDYINNTRYSLQTAVYDIYLYLKAIIEGKSKLAQGKWASRKIYNSTRNVITSHISEATELFGDKSVSTNQTVVGLYQYLTAIRPLAIFKLRDGFLSKVFPGPNSPAILVNKKTLKKELVTVSSEFYDRWNTNEGLEKVLANYSQENIRHSFIEIGDHYLGLIYLGGDNTYKLIQSIDEVPEQLSKDEIRPITLTELLYLSVFSDAHETPVLVTRYPVAGYGGIYPSYCYLRTTVKSQVRRQLDDNWQLTGLKAVEFPIINMPFFNSFCPSVSHVARLGADKLDM